MLGGTALSKTRDLARSLLPDSVLAGIRHLRGKRDLRDPDRMARHLEIYRAVTGRNSLDASIDSAVESARVIGLLASRQAGQSYWHNLPPLFPGKELRYIDDPNWDLADVYFVIGLGQSYARELQTLLRTGQPCFVLEETYLKNVVPGALAAQTPYDSMFSRSVAYMLDARGPAFYPGIRTQLEHDLESAIETLPVERQRATSLMNRIVAERVSKYNCQPLLAEAPKPTDGRRVLVIDQTYQDFAVLLSGGSEQTFARMLEAALDENPGAVVTVKTHVEKGGRETYYTRTRLPKGVRLFDAPTNPIDLLLGADTVYTFSSTMGWEGLMCRKEVNVFGRPIYSGWGLTRDRAESSITRARPRTIEDLFHFMYIRASRYIDPRVERLCQIETAIDFLVEARSSFFSVHAAQPQRS